MSVDDREFDYENYWEILDEDKMPVVVALEGGQTYGAIYTVQDWSPLCDPASGVRTRFVSQAIAATAQMAHREGYRVAGS